MRKIFSRILAVSIAVTIMVTAVSASARTVDIVCQMDASYYEEYPAYDLTMSSTMINVEYPFESAWSIMFNPTHTYITNLPSDSCSLSYGTACTTAACGGVCTNEQNAPTNHHKNMFENYYSVLWNVDLDGYDLMLTVTASNMCQNKNGAHNTGILGLGAVSGEHSFVKNNTTRGMMLNVRVIQHELSHNFGCNDGVCTPGYNCIMSGGFDNVNRYDLDSIWCPNCTEDFNSALH